MYREVTERPNRGAYQASYSPEMTQRLENSVAIKSQGLIKKVSSELFLYDKQLMCLWP